TRWTSLELPSGHHSRPLGDVRNQQSLGTKRRSRSREATPMQYRPTAEEFLAAPGDLLRDEINDSVPEALQHRERVGAHVWRIPRRELRLGPELAEHERAVRPELLDKPADDSGASRARRTELSDRLRSSDDPDFNRKAWEALVTIS